MNFFNYIGIDEDEFIEKYLNTGLVNSQKHPTLPLAIFSYSRKTVQENVWDRVTSRCRGIVIDTDTDEVIGRPFEKFHNFGSDCVEGLTPESNPCIFSTQPVIWEKMDGFMVTAFFYRNEWHAASKCSFTSIHAKWATAELRRKLKHKLSGRPMTLMFEGLHPDLRIVIDYKTPAELVLLTVIDNETGRETTFDRLPSLGTELGFRTPKRYQKTWQATRKDTGESHNSYGEEGYVLTWYPFMGDMPPFRLKMKYIDYLRLHRMVSGVSPKRIWEVLAGEQTLELDEYLNSSTPWFAEFVTKWMKAFKAEASRLENYAKDVYLEARQKIGERHGSLALEDFAGVRKTFAEVVTKHPEVSGICFAMLDKKDVRRVIWKQVRKIAVGSPMIDLHTT